MASSTKQKRHTKTKKEGRKLATLMFMHGKFTSAWTEDHAVNYFNMNKDGRSIIRTGKDDTTHVEWYLNENNEVEKKEIA